MNTQKILVKVGIAALCTGVAHAAALAQFDIDVDPTNDTQAGYTSFAVSGTSATANGITLTISGGGFNENRDRGTTETSGNQTPAGTGFSKLATDFVFARANETPTFGIAGLSANTAYTMRVWSWEIATGGTIRTNWYQDSIGAGNLVATHTVVQRDGTVEDLYFDATVTANSSGEVNIVAQTDSNNLIFTNGVEISAISAIPEPSVALLTGLTAIGLIVRRRR